MDVILDAKQIEAKLGQLARTVAGDCANADELAVIGIRSRGEVLAQRLAEMLARELGRTILCGTLDITLYRDDLNDPQGDQPPTVRSTDIDFDVTGKLVLLVDDVLHTGRSVRSAMDALIDLGRPQAIRLAVLIDRGHHELPIQADYAGIKVEVPEDKSVLVQLWDTDEMEQVVIE
ncbi:MAG: bifunctional pyr operon transcriptional regulator/uracil phosphoribosyltransferase PyrR [Sedimentisphaerales bacterium]|nr:bifunctional pyr operon transcriptional regulator/uracil phosphoribosyltransferase PyrR [Sedimentisphaerales bacterium]